MFLSIINVTKNTSFGLLANQIEVGNETVASVVELGEQLTTYRIGVYLFKYLTLPIAIWGWTGNFLSFRFVFNRSIFWSLILEI